MKNVRNSICFSLLLGVAVSAGTNSYAQAPAPAQAASKANVELFVIHAKEGPPFVDPLIGNMPQLAQPPFKSYTNFRLLDKQGHGLEKGKASPDIKLVNGSTLQLTFTEQDKEKRFHINVALSGKSKLDFVASPSVPFFLAGQPYNGGVLIIGVLVK